jgi:hypothetical protein
MCRYNFTTFLKDCIAFLAVLGAMYIMLMCLFVFG